MSDGRPQNYSEHVMRCLLAELDLTLALSGHRTHRDLGPECLTRTPA